MARQAAVFVALGFLVCGSIAVAQNKPTDRASAEDRAANVARYVEGGFGPEATKALGIIGTYSGNPPKFVISGFMTDSPAEDAGLQEYDWILEVDGSAVGPVRDRLYEPWQKYGRGGDSGETELLVSFRGTDGKRRYYYPKVSTQAVVPLYKWICPSDGFTIPKPRTRDDAELESRNLERYVAGNGFDTYSTHELGTKFLSYSGNGARIEQVTPGSPADLAGLKVGDMLLEVDGAPLGVIGPRTFEGWRQYRYSKDDEMEFCVAVPHQGAYKYYYPTIKLNKKLVQN